MGPLLLGICWLIRAPIFFVAVDSQVNISGAAVTPVVASTCYLSIASAGKLLVVAEHVSDAHCGLLRVQVLKIVAGDCETLTKAGGTSTPSGFRAGNEQRSHG